MCSTNPPRRILIVDDEPIIADSLSLIFNRFGFHSIAAYSGEEAVEAARVLNPEFLITDVVMGEMNGFDAALRICRTCPGCKAILLSGTVASSEILERALDEGHSFEFHAKPVHPEILLNKVRCAV